MPSGGNPWLPVCLRISQFSGPTKRASNSWQVLAGVYGTQLTLWTKSREKTQQPRLTHRCFENTAEERTCLAFCWHRRRNYISETLFLWPVGVAPHTSEQAKHMKQKNYGFTMPAQCQRMQLIHVISVQICWILRLAGCIRVF